MLIQIGSQNKNKKIVFNDDGDVVPLKKRKEKKRKYDEISGSRIETISNDESKKWYEIYAGYNITDEVIEMKDQEQQSLTALCSKAYNDELSGLLKKNPPDAKWLEIALHKGTSKDRCNAGVLILTTNPVGNIPTLEAVIGFARLSNKANSEVIVILTELFMEVLLPSNRKLISLQLRGASWKHLKKQELTKEKRNKIYAYWHFENRLKELYFEYLKNLQSCLQIGQEVNKNSAIISASKLLAFSPEKEQMILSMLVNKLGDPSSKVSAKVLHHLSEVGHQHPNMCGVITKETEKLLFRNNVSEKAQHFALCFLAKILPPGFSEVSTKVVNICFALFKVLVRKGAVNNKTMQAILRCLQKAIVDAKPNEGEDQILTKDMQDTIYRLVHLADIKISIQTLSLLLQMITTKSEKQDRFYNALYHKLTDLDLINIGNTTATQFLHIVHKSMHSDKNLPRVHAFLKRLLQVTLYLPTNFACGCLIVINKIIKGRKDLIKIKIDPEFMNIRSLHYDLSKFDGDDEEHYKDIDSSNGNDLEKDYSRLEVIKNEQPKTSSWHHMRIKSTPHNRSSEISKLFYDAYHRAPTFCQAESMENWELSILCEHFHPSLKLFVENIINLRRISYYGDPLRDFSLSYFLERFCFKNPKKNIHSDNNGYENDNDIASSKHHKHYVPCGGRNVNVKNLTKSNCTEDEIYIFKYLERKRELQKGINMNKEDEVAHDVDDDEFEEYLNGLLKQAKKKSNESNEELELDYMKELGISLNTNEDVLKNNKIPRKQEESDDEEAIDNWSDDDDFRNEFGDDEEDDDELIVGDDENDGSDESISLLNPNEINSDDEEFGDLTSDDENTSPKKIKMKYNKRSNFQKLLKEKKDIKSLFAAVDDFGEILEKAGKTKDHGTAKEVFNKDKSTEKQLKWEERRRSNYKNDKHWKKIKIKKNNSGKKSQKQSRDM